MELQVGAQRRSRHYGSNAAGDCSDCGDCMGLHGVAGGCMVGGIND